MEDSNIKPTDGISQESFELDLNNLKAQQVAPEGTPGETSPGDQTSQVDVDPKYAGLPEAEAIARTIQSRYDKLNIDYLQAMKDVQAGTTYKEILSDLYESDDALYAFLNERKPDLISNRDIKSEVTKRLVDKFGEGFEPELNRDEAERKDPGGKDWLYYQELDKIRSDVTNSGTYSKHMTLKEFRDARKSEIETENATIESEIITAKEELKMSDTEVEWNRKWAADLKFSEVVQISRFLRKFQNAPTMGNIPGSEEVGQSKSRTEFVDSLK